MTWSNPTAHSFSLWSSSKLWMTDSKDGCQQLQDDWPEALFWGELQIVSNVEHLHLEVACLSAALSLATLLWHPAPAVWATYCINFIEYRLPWNCSLSPMLSVKAEIHTTQNVIIALATRQTAPEWSDALHGMNLRHEARRLRELWLFVSVSKSPGGVTAASAVIPEFKSSRWLIW